MTLFSHLHLNFNIYAAKFSNDLFSHQPYKISRPARAPAAELGLGGSIRSLPLTPIFGPGASPLLMAGHRQVIVASAMAVKIYLYITLLFPLLTARAEVFLLGLLPWHALVWRRHGIKNFTFVKIIMDGDLAPNLGDQQIFSRPNFRKNFHFQGKNF